MKPQRAPAQQTLQIGQVAENFWFALIKNYFFLRKTDMSFF